MHRPGIVLRGERGVALVMALLVLLVLSLLGAVMMITINTDTKITSHALRQADAMNVAEAGIAEAVSRVSSDVDLANNPRGVAVIYNAAAGNVPVLGVDSTGFATGQTVGSWLPYSTATRDSTALTIKYRTNSARTQIYKYDPALNPPIQTGSGMPIYVISSTGRNGNDMRRIVSEVVSKPININIKAGLAVGQDIKFVGNAVVDGYNHSADTPENTGTGGHGTGGESAWETGSGDLTGAWSTGGIIAGGTSECDGMPATQANQAGFYAGPWEALGMTQPEFFSWVGNPTANLPGNDGIFYLDNDGMTQNASGVWNVNGVNGSGLLYVDGDLHLNAGFAWRGMIYVEGDFQLNGNAWILGAIIVKGVSEVKMNGGATILFSHDAITQNLAKYAGNMVTLSWKELQ